MHKNSEKKNAELKKKEDVEHLPEDRHAPHSGTSQSSVDSPQSPVGSPPSTNTQQQATSEPPLLKLRRINQKLKKWKYTNIRIM